MTVPDPASSGARLVSVDGRALALRSVALGGRAGGGLARVEVRQTFGNPFAEPLNVVYAFPLPADAAVAAYEIRIGDRAIRGEIDRRAAARERFDRALLDGRTAGLLDQERPDLFTQQVGNVPPGAEVAVVLTLDQPLAWEGHGWQWRFPTVVAPRYRGGRVGDAERVTVDVADGDTGVRASIELAVEDDLVGGVPSSASHRVEVSGGTVCARDVRLDRDVVVRWPVARPEPGVSLRTARPPAGAPHARDAYGVLTIVPPDAAPATLPRDVAVLLDVSGSMCGAPLRHAQAVVLGLIDSLDDRDRLEMTAFAHRPWRWSQAPVPATAGARRAAAEWVRSLEAGGGTEMLDAVEAALEPLREEAQRQVVLVSDGLIGFESDVIARIVERLPGGSRLHAVGVGAAANRGFLRAAARAGRGVEVRADLEAAPDVATARVVAATRGPALVGLAIEGDAVLDRAPGRPVDLMAGAPVRVALRLRPEGGAITVRGRTPDGDWCRRLTAAPVEAGAGDAAVVALFGREAVDDRELDLAAGAPRATIDEAIERLGLEFGLSTRLTSWVAVDSVPSVDPRGPVRVERVPQELAFGMSAEGLGLRAAGRLGATRAMRLSDLTDETTTLGSPVEAILYREPFASRRSEPPETTVSGRIARRDAGVTVIELEAPHDLDWSAPDDVTILDGSRSVQARVAGTPTTRPGFVPSGALVRVAIEADVDEGSVIVLWVDGRTLVVRLERT